MKETLKLTILFLLVLVGITGCKKDPTDDATADVYIKSILSDGHPVFGLAQYVIGYTEIASVTVSLPDKTSDQLSPIDQSYTIFYSEPSAVTQPYTSTVPAAGVYSYGVKFKSGVEKVFTNELTDTYLLPANIVSIGKSTDNSYIHLVWEQVSGADAFQINIYKAGIGVYSSGSMSLTSGQTSVDIPIAVIPNYSSGTYTVELNHIKYESTANGKIQAVSTASSDVAL